MSLEPAPLSKTAKYKKITKPLLERKRRARINRCLDELKDLMVGALEIDDDNLSKLEKADILELTVNHLTKLHSPKDPVVEAKKFQAGFGQCAAEACRFIMSVPDLDNKRGLISRHRRHLPRSSPTDNITTAIMKDHHRMPKIPCILGKVVKDSGTTTDPHPEHRDRALRWPDCLLLLTKYLHHMQNKQAGVPRNNTYFNRVPAETKDVILQKIRQHIMDKRGNDNIDSNVNAEAAELKYLQRDEPYRGEYVQQYSTPTVPSTNGTLDLRKVRSPLKNASEVSPKRPYQYPANQLDASAYENKVEAPASVPEQCESPMDYSNLPPKKKRKLIEYQEYKKQEEARRQLDAFYAEKKGERPPAPASADPEDKWRPW
ncbi:hypothetical protein O0L34_g579 [Tuta absoluta]|nr:hypothetical protein O0L34_g579 [Tuta absoluta]